MSQTLQSVLCITTNKYLVRVLVVLLHARFSVVGPIPFLLAAIFFSVHPYIGSTTVLPDILTAVGKASEAFLIGHTHKCKQMLDSTMHRGVVFSIAQTTAAIH